jgi:hypothetical protein
VQHFRQTLRFLIYILTLAFIVILCSCDRVKRKGHEVVDKTEETLNEAKQKAAKKKDQLIDKVFPTYDHDKADTENNRKRFKEHLQIDLTSDIKNIYAFGDFFGADYKVLVAFTCDKATIDKIVSTKK